MSVFDYRRPSQCRCQNFRMTHRKFSYFPLAQKQPLGDIVEYSCSENLKKQQEVSNKSKTKPMKFPCEGTVSSPS